MASNLDALRRGWVHVVQIFEPYVSMAVQEGGAASFTPPAGAG